MRRLLCLLGWHDMVYLGGTHQDPRPRRTCVACGRLWVRVRHDMDIYWDRIKPRSTDV